MVQLDISHAGHSPAQPGSLSAPVSPPGTPQCVPLSLFLFTTTPVFPFYLANLAENSKDEVSKQTHINLMKILIFQEVPELPIGKSVSALVKGSYALCSLMRSQTIIAAGLLCLTQVLKL